MNTIYENAILHRHQIISISLTLVLVLTFELISLASLNWTALPTYSIKNDNGCDAISYDVSIWSESPTRALLCPSLSISFSRFESVPNLWTNTVATDAEHPLICFNCQPSNSPVVSADFRLHFLLNSDRDSYLIFRDEVVCDSRSPSALAHNAAYLLATRLIHIKIFKILCWYLFLCYILDDICYIMQQNLCMDFKTAIVWSIPLVRTTCNPWLTYSSCYYNIYYYYYSKKNYTLSLLWYIRWNE